MSQVERVQVAVIGGAQAGLAVGYHLKRAGLSFVILDAEQRVGDSWRKRWDSLRLFSPARYSGLPGMRLPLHGRDWPTKDQMGDYLESYADRFELPVISGARVTRLTRAEAGFLIEFGPNRIGADQVVVAMSSYQQPRVPVFANDLNPDIVQLHSSGYQNQSQLAAGNVLVVGAANSGSEIALECARHRPTWLAGNLPPVVPFRIETAGARYLFVDLIRFLGHYVLTIDTPMGRKLRPKALHSATPLIRVKPDDLLQRGVRRVGKVTGVRNGLPIVEGGEALEVRNIIWCTGYSSDHSWIELPIFDEQGDPLHHAGVSVQPGLYFVGLHFLYSMTSGLINGVGRDAERIVKAIVARKSARPGEAGDPVGLPALAPVAGEGLLQFEVAGADLRKDEAHEDRLSVQ